MRPAHPIEQEIGIGWYASDTDGIGGRLKTESADFRVTELEGIDPEPVDADPGPYPHLIIRVTLTGWDTFDFVSRLAAELGLHRSSVKWAGTKDKAAVTTQLFSIEGVGPNALPDIPNADIEPIGRFGRGLSYGDLLGNTFVLRVRGADESDRYRRITDELESFGGSDPAIPNFFGHQRFGSRRPVTHKVGLAILRRDWEEAVMQYAGAPSEREPKHTREARAFIEETHDWATGLERMPRALGHERTLLASLRDADRDGEQAFRDALDQLSDQLQRLFVHAAQAYIFNRIVSERGNRNIAFGEAIEGDTVCFGHRHETLGMIPAINRVQRVTANRVDTVNRHLRNGRAFVTAPLVGSETELGEGVSDDIVQGVLDDMGITPSDFSLPDPYDSTGTHRPIIVRTDPDVEHDPLRFSFGLPSGAYATVVMREYLKVAPDAMA